MFASLIKKIASHLDRAKIPYMLIGGQAVLLYGSPRLTRDIDITLGVDSDQWLLMREVCQTIGLKILPPKIEKFVQETNVLPAEDKESRIRVDFIFSFSEYERQAIQRAKRVKVNQYLVRFASLEDMIIHKMIAGRVRDEEDVKNILLKNWTKIDKKYIEKWLKEFDQSMGNKELLDQFRQLMKIKS